MEYCKEVLNKIAKHIPILLDIEIESLEHDEDDYLGFSQITIKKDVAWKYYDKSYRYIDIIPHKILIKFHDENSNVISNSSLLHVLLHEISHCITPYIEKKEKKKWIADDHGKHFYDNYLRVMRVAYDEEIHNKSNMLTIRGLKKLETFNELDGF
jgi:hypothetical protein